MMLLERDAFVCCGFIDVMWKNVLYYVHNCMLLSIFFVHIMNFKFDYSKFVMDFSIVNL